MEPNAATRDIDKQADPIFKRMCDTLDGAKEFQFRVRATMDRPVETGQLAQFHRNSDICVARPDKLYATTESDDGHWSVYFSDKKLTVLDRDDNLFATEEVSGRIGDMLDYMVDEYDLVMPMADLIAGATRQSLLANVETGSYLGLHEVEGTRCHHLLFCQENIDWQIWIDAGDQPLPRKMLITYKQEADHPQYVAIIDKWNLSPAISEDTFKFTAPADAKSIAMSELVTQEEGD